jgi:Rrf2 family protein
VSVIISRQLGGVVILSKEAQYGVRAIVRLSSCWPTGKMLLRDIAEEEQLPVRYLGNIMLHLAHNGFVRSKKGSRGGYWLSRSPEQVLIGKLLRCLNGGRALAAVRRGTRGNKTATLTRKLDVAITRTIDASLRNLTLAELTEMVRDYQDNLIPMYHI